ncbi:hypothetical protein [Microbacterium sp. gxy059]|uniref:hypothetical protein n=1 Tax=Microbacterium sp. gxy059 TaxID=2957199 RepID=UPI003D95928E
MLGALLVMLGGPTVLAVQLGVDPGAVLVGVLAVGAIFGVVWFVEPLAYFPILGAASMYQAFLIGNNSNKLIPSAIAAQSTIGAKGTTRRGQLAAVLAICGAATTHLVCLLVIVGVFGGALVRLLPPELITTVQTYILPVILGAAIVQMISDDPNYRILAIAGVVGALIVFVLTPLVPGAAFFTVAIAVIATILGALFLPGRPDRADAA